MPAFIALNLLKTLNHFLTHYPTYQQTTEYSCGPAAALTVLWYYGYKDNTEVSLVKKMGTSSQTGTHVKQTADYFRSIGWIVQTNLPGKKTFDTYEKFVSFVLQELKSNHPILVANVSSVKLRNGIARNILTIRQLNESLVRALARGWQLKKISERGGGMRVLEKEVHMTKRTITRYINLCYLSPRIVGDILEYKNPDNLTLRELMNLAEGQVDFEKQEKIWSPMSN